MLLSIRERLQNNNALKYGVIGLISVPFALFGVNAYVSRALDPAVITVNDQSIRASEFTYIYQQHRSNLARRYGQQRLNEIPRAEIANSALRQAASDMLRRQVADEVGIVVVDSVLAREVAQDDAFLVDGRFDFDRYREVLSRNNTTPKGFEENLRQAIRLRSIQQVLQLSAFIPDNELLLETELLHQERYAEWFRFTRDNVTTPPASTAVEQSELEALYEQRKNKLRSPLKVEFKYIDLNIEDLAAKIDVTTDQVREAWEERADEFIVGEERAASHILLRLDRNAPETEAAATENRMQELRDRILKGESFADLARSFSADPGSARNGGSLGRFKKGVMVPEFEQSVFSLAVGDLSQPIRTDFGYHLIQVDDILQEKAKFSEVKDQVRAGLKRELAEEEYDRLRERLSFNAFEFATSLDASSRETGLPIQESGLVSDGEELMAHDAVRREIADLSGKNRTGRNSELIEVEEGRTVVVNLDKFELPAKLDLEGARPILHAEIIENREKKRIEEAAQKAVELLRQGKNPNKVSQELGGNYKKVGFISRRDQDQLPATVLETLFSLPREDRAAESDAKQQQLIGGGAYPLRIDDESWAVLLYSPQGWRPGNDSQEDKELAEIDEEKVRSARAQAVGSADFLAVLIELERSANIDINREYIEQFIEEQS